MKHFLLSSTVRSYPPLPYESIKNDILGKAYDLSLVFVGATRARSINKENRGKTYVPNVLSFPLDENHGEIYITPEIAKRESKKFGLSYKGTIGYLFIHGLLHLKGFDHGPKMERLEKRFIQKYKLS